MGDRHRYGGALLAAALVLCAGLARAEVGFTDVTESAGIDHVQHGVLSLGVAGEPPFMSGGAAAGDYDGDGWVDLFVTRYDAPDILYRNLGNGTFEDVAVTAGFTEDLATSGAVWADVDNDGDLDLYVNGLTEPRSYLYINDGAGHFDEEATLRGAAIASEIDRKVFSVAAGDYDNDGWVDLHTDEWLPTQVPSHSRLLRNRGARRPGHFSDATTDAGVEFGPIMRFVQVNAFASRFADLDNDGWVDLATAADFGTSRLFWNNGDGTFRDGTVIAGVGTDENGMGSAIGDYDNDGDLDWFVTSIFDPDDPCEDCNWGASGNRLYRNEGGRTFTDVTDAAGVRDGRWGWGTAFFDYDNDGDLDLVMTNGLAFPQSSFDDAFNNDPIRLWRNEGQGAMTEVAAAVGLTDTRSGKGLLVFDFDRDGDLDLFIANNGDKPVLYRNDGGNESAWLRVRPVGTQSARDSFGARVYVQATEGEVTQLREVSGGSHFLGQSEATVHFGFGSHAGVLHEVRVVWPASGNKCVLRAVSPNQVLTVSERTCGEPAVNGDADAGTSDTQNADASVNNSGATRGCAVTVTRTHHRASWLLLVCGWCFARRRNAWPKRCLPLTKFQLLVGVSID